MKQELGCFIIWFPFNSLPNVAHWCSIGTSRRSHPFLFSSRTMSTISTTDTANTRPGLQTIIPIKVCIPCSRIHFMPSPFTLCQVHSNPQLHSFNLFDVLHDFHAQRTVGFQARMANPVHINHVGQSNPFHPLPSTSSSVHFKQL